MMITQYSTLLLLLLPTVCSTNAVRGDVPFVGHTKLFRVYYKIRCFLASIINERAPDS